VAANSVVVKALIATYTQVQLEAARATAAADLLAGVQITQVTFEGGGASGRPISGDPAYVLEHIQAALDQMEDDTLSAQPSSAFMDLSKRPFGT
jgi:hypothetical protein